MEVLSIIIAVILLLLGIRLFWKPKPKREIAYKVLTQEQKSTAQQNGKAHHGPKVNVLVIGGQGCLGNTVVRSLVKDGGYKVHSLDLSIPPEDKRVPGVHAYIQTDITKRDDVMKALEGIEAVFLTASLQPCVAISDDLMRKVNMGGTQNIVDACKTNKVKRLIYTSSVSVTMGKNPDFSHDLIVETQPFPKVPLNAYVETKGGAELLVRGANGTDGLNTVALRIAGLLGGKNNQTMSFMMGPLLFYGGDGNFKIDYIDVDSATRAHIMAEKKLHKEQDEAGLYESLLVSNGVKQNGTHQTKSSTSTTSIAGKAYNITMRGQCSLKEIAEFVAEVRGVPRPIGVPRFILWPLAYMNTFFYNLTGLMLSPFSIMHVEFLVAFNFLPDLANKELGWVDEMTWKDITRKAIKEYTA